MSPVLGVLVAFPVYFIGSALGGPITRLIAALATLLAPFYSYRTNFAFFDTDGLLMTFCVSACLFALRVGTTQSCTRYWHLAGWAAC